MSYKDVTAGEKTAKPIAARFIKSPTKGTPGIEVAFEFMEPTTGALEKLNWVGWLSAKAIERTMETLVETLGSNGAEDTDASGLFTDPGFVDKNKEVKLVVEMESYTNDKGEEKSAAKIKWVNSLGGSQFSDCAPEVVKNELGGVGFRGAFLAAQKASGQTTTAPPQMNTNEPLPF